MSNSSSLGRSRRGSARGGRIAKPAEGGLENQEQLEIGGAKESDDNRGKEHYGSGASPSGEQAYELDFERAVEECEAPLVWAELDASTIDVLTRGGRLRFEASPFEQARGGISLEDVVQEAITEMIETGAVPSGHEAAVDEVVRLARRRWKSWKQRVLARSRSLDAHQTTLSSRDLFEVICARDEHMKFVELLYAEYAKEPAAVQVIYALIEKGFLYHQTKAIAEDVGAGPAYVSNLKRRIERSAKKIMIELTTVHPKGGRK